jgi:hypothetical protein
VIPLRIITAFGDEFRTIIKNAEAKTAGSIGKLITGKMRPVKVPTVGLPTPKVV